jgi:hypothetical protein
MAPLVPSNDHIEKIKTATECRRFMLKNLLLASISNCGSRGPLHRPHGEQLLAC